MRLSDSFCIFWLFMNEVHTLVKEKQKGGKHMICPKCGAQLPDDAKFCGVCGNSITADNANQIPPQQPTGEPMGNPEPTTYTQPNNAGEFNPNSYPQQTNYNENSQQQANNNYNGDFQQQFQDNGQQPNPAANKAPFFILGGIVIVAIIVIVLIFNLIFGNNYETPIKDLVKFLNKQSTDVEDFLKVLNGESYGEYQYELAELTADIEKEDDWEDDVIDNIEDTYDDWEDDYGKGWDVSYEIRRKTELKTSELKTYKKLWKNRIDDIEDQIDRLEDNDDYSNDEIDDLTDLHEKWAKKFDKMEVKEGYKLKVRLTIEGDDEEDSDSRQA